MSCFFCLNPHRKRHGAYEDALLMKLHDSPSHSPGMLKKKSNSYSSGFDKIPDTNGETDAISFTFLELAEATKSFREDNLIGEGGFGKVYKGHIGNGQEIAAKRLNSDGLQGNQEFIVEVLMLSLLHHTNLVKLIGYCAEGEHRILVYEYMSMGSLADHLYESGTRPVLGWNTRMRIAVGSAKGLEYLHCRANPPVIYRDLKSANILLDDEFNPRLSDFGLAKLGPVGDDTHVSTRIMGTYGYCAPDYAMSGKLTTKSDIWSFGVVLLELVTGRKAFDHHRPQGEQSLVAWSRPLIRDRKRSTEMVDPKLEGRFPERATRHLIALIAMLLKEDPNARPPISEIVVALEYLAAESDPGRARTATSSSSSSLSSPTLTISASASVIPL